MAANDEKVVSVVATLESTPSLTLVTRPTLKTWPSDAEPLIKPKSAQWPLIAFDVVMIIFPLALILKTVLCIVAAHIDRKSTGQSVDQVHPITLYLIQFNSQLTTLFTIIFMTIISTLVRRVALWRAQKGASVAELEQWQASISLPGTLKTIWSLRMYTVTSVALVFLWSWYYLGSQASTREFRYQEAGNPVKMQITVTNPSGPSYLDDLHFPNLTNLQKSATNAQFASLLVAPWAENFATQTGYDKDGLPLIPYIDHENTKADRHGFFDGPDPSRAIYPSGVGVQTYAMFPDLNNTWAGRIIGKLSFNTSYLQIQCAPMQAQDISAFPNGTSPQMAVSLNVSSRSNTSTQGPAMFEVWYRSNDTGAAVQTMSSLCNVTTVPLQVKAQCTAQGCVVNRLKPIGLTDSASDQTLFIDATFAARFYNELLWSTGSPSEQTDMAPVELMGWPIATVDNLPDGSLTEPTDIDILTMALPENIGTTAANHNLTIPETYQYLESLLVSIQTQRVPIITNMFNTYLAMYQQNGYAFNDVFNSASSMDDLEADFNGNVPNPWLTVAQLHGTYWNPQYALNILWIVVDFISCSILLLAGAAAVYLRTRILAPDIFGFVSSLTRDNPNVPLPHAASTLSGMERARMLKRMKVQIADVEADHDVGKVSLTQYNAHPQTMHTSRLVKERRYM